MSLQWTVVGDERHRAQGFLQIEIEQFAVRRAGDPVEGFAHQFVGDFGNHAAGPGVSLGAPATCRAPESCAIALTAACT